MYSRSRMTGEERYRSELPPTYSGSRFSCGIGEDDGIPVSDERKTIRQQDAEASAPQAETPQNTINPELPPEKKTSEPQDAGAIGHFLSAVGQEDVLLLALILLLCAEHERSMDVIVILLLLTVMQ